ncbi:hypothetical protein J3Q64DRAFT_1496777 [Phycomyces blakesleeanus]|uniref:Secreted protein n=1 Tax=Phycomyces blakesleeanus TaxID=4837 RepID=A0ABR3B0S7_PHYBL
MEFFRSISFNFLFFIYFLHSLDVTFTNTVVKLLARISKTPFQMLGYKARQSTQSLSVMDNLRRSKEGRKPKKNKGNWLGVVHVCQLSRLWPTTLADTPCLGFPALPSRCVPWSSATNGPAREFLMRWSHHCLFFF